MSSVIQTTILDTISICILIVIVLWIFQKILHLLVAIKTDYTALTSTKETDKKSDKYRYAPEQSQSNPAQVQSAPPNPAQLVPKLSLARSAPIPKHQS